MTEEQISLGRRAVACKGWRWMRGCRVAHIEYGGITTDGRGTYLGTGMQPGDMCIQWDDHAPRGLSSNWSSPQNFQPAPHVFDYCVPDLTDPATLGCLLALVREAWGKADAYVMPWDADDGGWTVCVLYAGQCRNVSEGDTEAEALVEALEGEP